MSIERTCNYRTRNTVRTRRFTRETFIVSSCAQRAHDVVRERCLRKRGGGPATFHLACLADGSRAQTRAPERRTCGIQLSIVAASVCEQVCPIGRAKTPPVTLANSFAGGIPPARESSFRAFETARTARGRRYLAYRRPENSSGYAPVPLPPSRPVYYPEAIPLIPGLRL